MNIAFSSVNQFVGWCQTEDEQENSYHSFHLIARLARNLQPESRFLSEKNPGCLGNIAGYIFYSFLLRLLQPSMRISNQPVSWNQYHGMGDILFGPQVVDLVPVWLKKGL